MPFDKSSLLDFLAPGNERVGFVLSTGEVVEVDNICTDPINGFEVSGDDLVRYEDSIVASWHTHPGKGSNLSQMDYESFLNYPDWQHHVVGEDGVATYYVEKGRVLIA